MKTKLGISNCLLAASVYLCALFGWTTSAVLIAGYILIFEQDRLVKISAVKAITIIMAFDLLGLFVGFIPDTINLIDRTLEIFENDFSLNAVTRIVSWINLVMAICEKILLLALMFAAFKQKTIIVPFVDKLLTRHFPAEGAVSSPVQQPTAVPTIKFCKHCGKQLSISSDFCSNCGNKA